MTNESGWRLAKQQSRDKRPTEKESWGQDFATMIRKYFRPDAASNYCRWFV